MSGKQSKNTRKMKLNMKIPQNQLYDSLFLRYLAGFYCNTFINHISDLLKIMLLFLNYIYYI